MFLIQVTRIFLERTCPKPLRLIEVQSYGSIMTVLIQVLIMDNCKARCVFLPGQIKNTAAVQRNVPRGTLQ